MGLAKLQKFQPSIVKKKKREGKAETPSSKSVSADVYLVVFLRDPGGDALAVVAAVGAAGAVSAAALHQEAAWPENGVGLLQLLAQRHGEVARRAAVQSNFVPQQIEIRPSLKGTERART